MKMPNISVVIPNYNSKRTIRKTLKSLEKQTYKEFDVTIADDCSTDNSVEIIQQYIKNKKNYQLIKLKKNKGPATARNAGVKASKNPIIFFTDSDVILKSKTLERIAKHFINSKTNAVCGYLDKKSVFKNLSSIHFNTRIHHNYSKLPKIIPNIYTSACAIRRTAFQKIKGFQTKMRSEEDPDLGYRLTDAGYKIILDKKLTVYHYKHMTFKELMRNDYKRSIGRVKLMFRRKMTKNTIKKGKFISTPKKHMYSALLLPIIYVSLAGGIIYKPILTVFVLTLIVFLYLYWDYLLFISKNMGVDKAIGIFLLLLIDMIFVDLGLLVGILKYVRGDQY